MLFGLTQDDRVYFHAHAEGTVFVPFGKRKRSRMDRMTWNDFCFEVSDGWVRIQSDNGNLVAGNKLLTLDLSFASGLGF